MRTADQKRRRIVNTNCTKCKWKQWRRLVNTSSTNMGMLWSLLTRRPRRVIGGNRSIINRGNLTRINIFRQYIDEHPMLLMFSRGFKDIVTKTAFFKEFPGLENKFQNSRGFKEIKDPYEPCSSNVDLTYFANRHAVQSPAKNVNNLKKCARGTMVASLFNRS